MRKKFFLFLILLTAFLSSQKELYPNERMPGDKKNDQAMIDVIPLDKIPPAPVLNPKQAAKTFEVGEGFKLELVAAEPQVSEPVALAFDGNGRMWVCEMTTYMLDINGTGEEVPKGNIVILEDSDEDGKVDKRTVFLNDVILPRAIAVVKGGIIYADHTKLYFSEVLKGDKVGIREVIDPIYAKGGSLEHKPNGFIYGIDNWYYSAKTSRRHKLIMLSEEAPKKSIIIHKNKYWQLVVGRTEFRGQWGITVNDYGKLFHNHNSITLKADFLMPNTFMRNSRYSTRKKNRDFSSERIKNLSY